MISPANRVILCSSPALDVDAMALGVGLSHCISVGNRADLELADFVDDMGGDDFALDVNPLLVNANACCALDARLRRE